MTSQREAEIELGEVLPLLQNRAPQNTQPDDKSNNLLQLALYLLGGAVFLALSGLMLIWSRAPAANYQGAARMSSTAPPSKGVTSAV